MQYVWELLNQITSLLTPVTDNPRFEAELLLAHSLGISRSSLLARIRDTIVPPDNLNELITQRLNNKPLAYILGYTEFYSLRIFTKPPVFIPRPETELLVEKTIDIIENITNKNLRILELCTGSGCIPIALSKNTTKNVFFVSTDISEEAITLAKQNANYHKVNINFVLTDLFLAFYPQPFFDIILSNPPYVSTTEWYTLSPVIRKYEDEKALIGGNNGLKIIQLIVDKAKHYLMPGGFLLFEIGENQKEDVIMLLSNSGYSNIEIYNDLQNLPRVVICRWKSS